MYLILRSLLKIGIRASSSRTSGGTEKVSWQNLIPLLYLYIGTASWLSVTQGISCSFANCLSRVACFGRVQLSECAVLSTYFLRSKKKSLHLIGFLLDSFPRGGHFCML
jgi:hypothetical protein